MSISKKVLKLRQSILKANTQLDQIRESGLLDTSEETNIRYNKILLEKAIYKKELDEAKQPVIQRLFKKIAQSHTRDKKLICDYFKP